MIELERDEVTGLKSVAKTVQVLMTRLCPILTKCLYVLLFFLVFALGHYDILVIFTIGQNSPWWTYSNVFLAVWIIFNIIFNYAMAVMTKPGSPDSIPMPILSHIEHRCNKCNLIKPPRTHHCSLCNECVLQMDHHCPWIGTCVGHHNRRYFLNFISYINFGLIHLLYLATLSRFDMTALAFVLSLLGCLGCFTLFHWYISLRGRTSLECCWQDRRYKPSESIDINLKIIFGTSNIFLCFMPSTQVLENWGNQWQIV